MQSPFAGQAGALASRVSGYQQSIDPAMDPNDPFGYRFEGNPGILDDEEAQNLIDFFKNTDPNSDSSMPLPQPDSWDGATQFSFPPAELHGVSTTIPEIPDRSQYGHGYTPDQLYPTNSFPGVYPNTTHQDIEAASTLYRNAQIPLYNETPYGSHIGPLSNRRPSALDGSDFGHIPRVPTSQGHLNEQLAAILPRHSISGTVDASIAAQFSQAQDQHEVQLAQVHGHRPSLKRSFTFGTDNAFNQTGYVPASPLDTEAAVTQRLMNTVLHAAHPTNKDTGSTAENTRPSTPVDSPSSLPIRSQYIESGDDAQSRDETDGEDDRDRNGEPAKKRPKNKHETPARVKTEKGKESVGPRSGKARKASHHDSAKRRHDLAQPHKNHRQNLTEEQKRNNHILSEQKRRNLIAKHYTDLNELVPDLRAASLSRSNVLQESAKYLERLVTENQKFSQILSSSGG